MSEYKYEVYVGRTLVASDMSYETASVLMKGLFEKYYEDLDMQITILRMKDNYEDEDEE